GVAQGLGQALVERTDYDLETGQLLTGSFMDYALPRADDLPDIEVDLLEVPSVSNPLGVKGAGEAGSVGSPPALINAIIDALSADGVTHIDMPAALEQHLGGSLALVHKHQSQRDMHLAGVGIGDESLKLAFEHAVSVQPAARS